MRQIFVDGRIPSLKHGASIRPTDEYPLKNMRQVFIHGRIPSQKHGASIRPRTNTDTLSKHGTSIRPRTNTPSKTRASIRTRANTLCKTWASIRLDEYSLKNMRQVVVRGRVIIPFLKRGANTHLCFEYSTIFKCKS